MSRFADAAGRVAALLAAIVTAPIVVGGGVAVWLQDRRSPVYAPLRVGLGGQLFRLFKLRSMVIDADRSEVDTTIAGDPRLTRVGRAIRRFKLDELPQFWNVILGDMTLVGPRPNVSRETALYTADELRILSVKPGITDFSSIVFSDLGAVLSDADDPNIAYNQLIRPWKSRLVLFYIDNQTWLLDLQIIALTALCMISRRMALWGVAGVLRSCNAPQGLVEMAMRKTPLEPTAPPGATDIVLERNV